MAKCIIYMPADKTKPAVMFTPNMGDRRCVLSDDGEKMFAAFPEVRASMLASASQFPAEQVDRAPNPFAGVQLYRPETDDEMMARHAANPLIVPPGSTDVHMVDAGAIPQADEYRDAWIIVGGAVNYNMDKARNIKRDTIREARTVLFTGLDIEYMRLQEQINVASKEFDAASAVVANKVLAGVKVSDDEAAASNAAKAALEEIEAKQADIVRRKQALRDAPADPRIDAATTIDELRAIPVPTSA